MTYEFHGIVNNEKVIICKTLSQLKRIASRFANKFYKPIDTMKVLIHNIERCENVEIIHFTRINKVTPWNTIQRGKWK